MLDQIQPFMKKPALYAPGTAKFWDDPHISKGMLDAHLNPDQDAASRKRGTIRESVRWIAEAFPPSRYRALLDLGCGPGLYAEDFHAAGYRVTGVDLSKRSIEYAQASALSKKLDIRYLRGDYLGVCLPEQYDLVTLIYCDFGVLPDSDRAKLLRRVYGWLRSGGCLLFDVFTPAAYAGREEHRDWEYCANGGFWSEKPYLCLNSLYRYEEESTFLRQHIVAVQGGAQCINIWEHTFTTGELARDLAAAGFRTHRLYGDVTGNPVSGDGTTLCVAAFK